MSVPERLGDFEIVAEIGRGGFGVVYRARQVSLGRPVALKVLYEHRVHTTEEVSRFEREARAAARLDHPAVVSVFAWGQDKGSFYIAQKLVGDGLTLADTLEKLKTSGEHPKGYFREIAETLAIVLDGMQHAHEEGIVHRDLKPSNILLDEKNRPYLGDFGLAKVEDGLELSRTGDFAGSPYYMSPEQADSRRGEADHRSDIYGMGVTLYEMLTLQPPFHGRSPHEIIRKILTEEPKPPSKVVDRVPRDLETIAMKAMEKSRPRRYQSASEMAADLRSFLDGEPISASPVSTVSRVFRVARRNRTGVGIVLLAAALLVAAVQIGRQSQTDKQRQEQQANTQSAFEAATTERKQVDEELDEELTAAIDGNDRQRAARLREFGGDYTNLVDTAQRLLMDVMPDISDNETLKQIGESLKGEGLTETMETVSEYLAKENADGEAADPKMEDFARWLANKNVVGDAARELELQVDGLFGADREVAVIERPDTGSATESDPQTDPSNQVAGPPTGPSGIFAGSGSTSPSPEVGSGGDGADGEEPAEGAASPATEGATADDESAPEAESGDAAAGSNAASDPSGDAN